MTQTALHTPGDWVATSYEDGKIWLVEVCDIDDGEGTASTVASIEHEGEEGEANARLIAAAPDLLAALKEMSMHWPAQPPKSPAFGAYARACAAIAKATK